MKSQVKKRPQIAEESVESKPLSVQGAFSDMGKGVMESFWKDLLVGSATDSAPKMLWGTSGMEENQLKEGQAMSLKKKKEEEKAEKKVTTSEHIEYFRTVQHPENNKDARVEMEVRQQVEQIRMEIKKLLKTSKLVEQSVKDATADQAPVKPGKYHLNFFEFVLSVIKDATRKLEDSVSYGAIFASKKQQSKYWSSYKKHGTSFGLSSERSTATQTG